MRRTYRSKKDAGSALDHRDVLLTVDEKTSTFEAFSIQNIKQTKRELSCMGTSTQCSSIASKNRKKKLVKRIIKEVENIVPEATSRSTYLTPDKSIRVNKGQDLFDQLLNTSSNNHATLEVKKEDVFDKICSGRPAKTYGTRKARKVKKYNYSSTDSNDTDKENDRCNSSKNATDIRAHKLVVEKDVPNSPRHQDESINNIVQNLSLLNSMKNSNSSNSPIIPFNYSKKRTKQLKTITQDKPVLSSTPFRNIRTATSIYKFSPISRMSYGESSHYITVTEENENKIASAKCEELPVNGVAHNVVESITNADNAVNPNNIDTPDVSIIEHNRNKHNINSCAVKNVDITPEETGIDTKRDVDQVSILSDSLHELTVSLGGSKPSQLFFGFTVISSESDVAHADKISEDQLSDASKRTSISSEIIDIVNNSELKVSPEICKSSKHTSGTIVKARKLDKGSVNESRISNNTEENNSYNSDISNPRELESLYDTCSSEKLDEVSHKFIKVPVVRVARLEDAVFQEYYDKMAAYTSDLSGVEDMDEESDESHESIVSNDNTSLNVQGQSNDANMCEEIEIDSDDYSNPHQISDNSKVESDGENKSAQETETDSGSIFGDLESNSNDDDEEVRCFVNTRRRVTIKNNSNKLSLENTSSSSGCNKTVLSNNKLIGNSSKENEILVSDEDAKINLESNAPASLDVETITLDSDEAESKTTEAQVSFVTTRKSFKKHNSLSLSPDHCIETKPVIVLQPGKKWERSLSIYRRMTMMNDHFDRSLLENVPMNCKGRKYRQSVISTMEMQEGSLHNESISSRRSTFVVKPSRSTIRILKDTNDSRISLCNSTIYDDLKGFLSDDCDDTIVELSKLSIADSDHEITVVEKLHEDRFTTARDYVLRRCNQTDAIPFDECYPDTALKNCHKIGEGVYGEVFLWRARDGRARVMKIVPIAGTTKVNGEHQKDFHEIISEIVIAMELSALRTPIADLERQFDEGNDVDALELHTIQNATEVFNEVLAVRCVYGSYTSRLLDLWELYDECKGSENDSPAILPSDQQYIVLELANAGQDLESYQFNSAEQAHALFYQVAFGLAVGEEAFQFEHRDLHWGNVLIAPTEQKSATFVIRGRAHRVPRSGVAATIIDYSLSRLALPLAAAGDAAALYHDLAADDSLFDAVGDYQFEVYRLMREKLRNDWKNFEPYTNILWLHYTVDKMISALRYKRTNTKIHKHYISKLKSIKNRILSYGSAVQFVLTDIE